MTTLPITRIVLYKHGVGYFEREGSVEGDTSLSLTFKQNEVSDVLKSLTVLDLAGGHISSVSYDSTKPLEQLLAEVALKIPDEGSVVGLIPQIKGARVALHSGVADPVEGSLLGVDTTERQTGDGIVRVVLVSVLTDTGSVRSFDLHNLASLQILDDSLRRDLEFYLRTQLSATRKDARTFTFFAQGSGSRTIRLSYTLEAPVWKATYRIILGSDSEPSLIQGWAVVDNTQDEDWQDVQLSLVSGLPVSFTHDLYTPRYIRRPEVKVKDTTGVLPPEVEAGDLPPSEEHRAGRRALSVMGFAKMVPDEQVGVLRSELRAYQESSTPVQVREQAIGDLLEYQIEHPVTIRRNQSALVPIVLRSFEGKPVLLYNRDNRKDNPMSCVLFKNTTGLTLEGGPVTVLQEGSYVGEAMLETIKPDEERLVPYAVELGVRVLDNIDSHEDHVHRVHIRNGMLAADRRQVQVITYTFNNLADREHTLYLEQPRLYSTPPQRKEWELFETPAPHEITENFWRFKIALPKKQTATLVIRQRYTTEHRHQLTDLSMNSLGYWIEQRYFDSSTEQVLRQIAQQKEEEARLKGEMEQLEGERSNIYSAQQRIRDNLQTLTDRAAERELRERFVRTLNEQEDRLEIIDREIKAKHEARQHCRDRIKELLEKLDYDAPVQTS
jgi:hypothetical protein